MHALPKMHVVGLRSGRFPSTVPVHWNFVANLHTHNVKTFFRTWPKIHEQVRCRPVGPSAGPACKTEMGHAALQPDRKREHDQHTSSSGP